MNQAQWVEWLEASLQDAKLDDNERRELKSTLVEKSLTKSGLSEDNRAFLRNRSFQLATQVIDERDDLNSSDVIRWLERVVKTLDSTREAPSKVSASWFSPGQDCINGIMEQLRLARNNIDICVFTIADNRLTESILAVHERGVKVRIITDNDKTNDKGSDIDYLSRKGINVKIDTSSSHMHHKFAIFDDRYLINGSFNWTNSASKYNQEDITLTDDKRFIIDFRQQFDTLWQRFPLYKSN